MPLPAKIIRKQILGTILFHPYTFQYVFLKIRTLVKHIVIAILQKINTQFLPISLLISYILVKARLFGSGSKERHYTVTG